MLERGDGIMKLIYEIGTTKEGGPKVMLSHNGDYLGTIWGTVHQENDDFDQEYGIISIKRDEKVIAYLWHTEPKAKGQ